MSYVLVEFATAVKPLLLAAPARGRDQALYLDPDTYLAAPAGGAGPGPRGVGRGDPDHAALPRPPTDERGARGRPHAPRWRAHSRLCGVDRRPGRRLSERRVGVTS